MNKKDLDQLRFPVGKYSPGDDYGMDEVMGWIEDIKALPSLLRKSLKGITDADLEKTYRPGSWTVRQVVHHLGDSHINAYVRMKRTLTEDVPTIQAYEEKLWAEMDDVKSIPIATSVSIITGIHTRLYEAIKDISIKELSREFKHVDYKKPQSMAYLIGMYAWHGRHHVAHIKLAFT